MNLLLQLKALLEYVGGAAEAPPPGFHPLAPVVLGLFWGLLLCAILVFSGQTSKFIYIDF